MSAISAPTIIIRKLWKANIIKAKTAKSRLSKENQEVNVRLFYDERGLDPVRES